jgi:hypothetical protein
MENRPGHEPANSGNVRKGRRGAPRGQEEINTPRNTGAGRQQTAKQKKNNRNENWTKVRNFDLTLGK